ncbi:hypothetical protein GCK72_000128 [Caenorhabditis remanei]|uniref:F-box domain-containing protein n=1 Tax=Caenorhabditis remanei TaxID=31234 RepID=A0A6A5HNR9_CAERE|nr:hypothetical protein GCK72_000128 [Caenorhabditis remanei]KAF1768316.1 hypothetical protein GCK72_000128 [Caenorhabditis remanei]
MSSIKLLSFPFLIFSEIVRSMGIMEIFELSQVSRRALNYLNLARISKQMVNVVTGQRDAISFFNTNNPTENELRIHFLKTSEPIIGQIKVNNVCINVCERDGSTKTIRCNSNQFAYGLVHMMTHFDKLFYRMEYAIGIKLSTIRGDGEILSNGDCEYLLETTRPTLGITIFNKLSPDFNYKKILHFSRLRVPNLGKMPLEDLKALDSEIANLGNHQFSETDINEFLHHWIKGNNGKLRRLKLDGFKEAPDWDILLKDIVYTAWNTKERKRYYKSKYTDEVETINCENGKDFMDKDGQLATVVHHSEFLDILILHFSRLRVPNLGKMPLEDLKALDSEIANLGNHQFTEADINEFLHHWIKGNNRKLRRLKLDGFKEAPDWDVLLKDIVYTEWNPKERGRYYKSKYTHTEEIIDCENGRDFRNKDGQLATVVHHSEFLDFLVWNDRFLKYFGKR